MTVVLDGIVPYLYRLRAIFTFRVKPSPLWQFPVGETMRPLEPQGRAGARGVKLDRSAPLTW